MQTGTFRVQVDRLKEENAKLRASRSYHQGSRVVHEDAGEL